MIATKMHKSHKFKQDSIRYDCRECELRIVTIQVLNEDSLL